MVCSKGIIIGLLPDKARNSIKQLYKKGNYLKGKPSREVNDAG